MQEFFKSQNIITHFPGRGLKNCFIENLLFLARIAQKEKFFNALSEIE